MVLRVYGMPACAICDNVYILLSNASKAGRLKCVVEKKSLVPDKETTQKVCSENMVDLAFFGLYDPPAVVLVDDNGDMVWGQSKITGVNQVSVHDISENIPDVAGSSESAAMPTV